MILCRLFFTILCLGQMTLAQAPDKDEIIRSQQYYTGTGISADAGEARDKALAELISRIAVYVEKSYTNKVTETNTALTDEVQSILESHSTATLKNVEMLTEVLPDGEISVFCYIHKDRVEEIFLERKKLIADMTARADRYALEANAAFALKLYYFSLILMNTLPDQNVIYEGVNYSTDVPNRINDLLMNVQMAYLSETVISPDERQITLRVTLDHRPVTLLDFTFWDGTNQISVQARDGIATFKLFGASTDFEELRTSVKYSYYECRKEFRVIAQVWGTVVKPVFSNTIIVPLKAAPGDTAAPPAGVTAGLDQEVNLNLAYDGENTPVTAILKNTAKFLKILGTSDPEEIQRAYGDDPFLADKITRYIAYNHPEPLERNIAADINPTRNGWELRRIRVLQEYPGIHRQTTEYLVLDFSEDGKLEDINLSISDFLYDKFAASGDYGQDWNNRQEIIKFIEKYRSAYQTRDIGTIDKLFSEDALIIKGRVLQRKNLPADLIDSSYKRIGDQPEWEQIRLTKSEFLKNEQSIFDSQQDLLIEFSSFNIIQKNNTPNVYGIELRQSYTVTTYQDEGYLFLLIDFNEPDPLIYVRAWQPNTWDEDELIRTANFKIYK